MIPGSIGIRVIYLGRLRIINTLLMKSGNNTVKIQSFGGWYISGEISRKTKGAIDAFRAMGNNARMSLEVFLLLFLLGLTEKGCDGD